MSKTLFAGPGLLAFVVTAALVLCGVQAAHGFWVGDLFPHAAAVRELAVHPFRPSHPMFALDVPHAFFSPYHLLVAVSSRLSGVPAISAMAVFGLINVAFLCYAVRRFIARIAPGEQRNAVPLALLFILFVWGTEPWIWSGFVHWQVLPWVAPYPSTLVVALTFFTLSVQVERIGGSRRRAAVIGLTALCFLIHPVTAAVLVACSAVLVACRVTPGSRVREGVMLLLCVAAGFVLALAWPYFSLWSLLTGGDGGDWNAQSAELYVDPFRRMWPIVLWSPLMARRLWRDSRDPLTWLTLTTLAIYLSGAVIGKPGLGRFASWTVMWAHITAAVELATLRWHWRGAPLAPAAGLVLALGFAAHDLRPLGYARAQGPFLWQLLSAVSPPIGNSEVVLVDVPTGEQLVAITGRIVASYTAQFWVPDHGARKLDVALFFGPETTELTRRAIIRRYHARWLLLNQDNLGLTRPELNRLIALGELRSRLGPLTLVALTSD
jgi:hypothetical protein